MHRKGKLMMILKNKKKTMSTKEKPPKKNKEKAIWDLVIRDMKERDKVGQKRYGTRLQPFNGRNSPVDALQEFYDLIAYTRQWVIEREETIKVLKYYSNSCDCYDKKCEWRSKSSQAKNLLRKLGELDES